MKKKLLLLLLLGNVCITNAQSTLNIRQKDGGVVSYSFSENPRITYFGQYVVLKTTKTEVEYPVSNLANLTFENSVDKIEQVTATHMNDHKICIYNINGVLLKTIYAENGVSSISLDGLKTGIYIVKNGSTTYKIIKR